ncbi:ubiquitin carboxyl-terminal hydrolase 1 [Sphaeramia orbicularis]|uniref:Ubiquitin carboxyl-terminal hydrolase n=1 Tax=Sphaeramia orbicularis TaxID=375764 RepID=A0A673C0A2_9TELE|nr:ubiquitin carboxyl-terminal hydrolase 1 [Sphaeramia orbicularis]XP_029988051.1 ubiquitin carboxyl-terminal hydrolase 1 [Sphaeramia orbicularis]XP_029988052.1 ubiquitin carboxyl-terminal hydrolase 1 [Sphaeramia orbicularis]XP_029988053.1 ubiquitin carboxyl-terminal hydrolase 1 [Sphaeramia orbicularis]XP_029988054.1 ubiquitin carboxyl-terminal hydrolase 1 [Sphaeramia orbicularis]XP_029988055.1 ubiquitin carboxyl-terminal hydrolase 1 [Sphaeramia orbicularis]
MPGLQGENVVAALGSPIKKSKLSLKFFQKKETKRALDFSEPEADEPKTVKTEEPEPVGCDQEVPGPSPCPISPGLLLPEKRENLVPFVGLNNLGNTCYLNSVLQVLYYCPGLREGIKKLYNLSKRKDKPKEEAGKSEESEGATEPIPPHIELLGSFNSLITSVEQLQSSFLLSPDSFSEGDLATPPRKILHTLRQLNPMYEGYLQHDAQEVLQCILGYIQEACDTIRKEQDVEKEDNDASEVKMENGSSSVTESKSPTDDDSQVSGKRKSDTEVGNAKKKPKSVKSKKSEAEETAESKNKPATCSKRKSSSNNTIDSTQDKDEEEDGTKKPSRRKEEDEGGSDGEKTTKETDGKKKKRAKLSWLRRSSRQPSIFSKFCSVGKITSTTVKNQSKTEEDLKEKSSEEKTPETTDQDKTAAKNDDGLDLMERLFHGQLVLRTRCLECESFTERREDFQDISVPVLEDQPSSPDDLSDVSPDPKPELKTLNWAIAQFASVERIVGEDKYFCETCHHYTEAERSLMFDKTPEVITIHLKRFSANSLELDLYAGLSKVNTPLQTPLTLSLEEWCTRRSAKGQQYQLFAVVMHSGVTISSGHYTAYVRMSDLKDVKLSLGDDAETKKEEEEESKTDAPLKDEVLDYDDGEVSFSVSSRGQRASSSAKTGGKKLSEGGVGLLGGQRSLSACDLGNNKHADKAGGGGTTEGSKRRRTIGTTCQSPDARLKKDPDAEDGEQASAEKQALSSLLEYDGKWMLFDDSEVRLFEEDDFLRACSPETASSSTPYLLFYRRIPGLGR